LTFDIIANAAQTTVVQEVLWQNLEVQLWKCQ